MPHTFGRIGEYDAHVIGSLSTSLQRIVELIQDKIKQP